MHLQAMQPKTADNHQELGERPGADPFSITLRGNQPWRHFGLGLAASKPLRKYVSVFKAPQTLVLCYGNPRKLIQDIN